MKNTDIAQIPAEEITAWLDARLPSIFCAEVEHRKEHGKQQLLLNVYVRANGARALTRKQSYCGNSATMTEGEIKLEIDDYAGLGVISLSLLEDFFATQGYAQNEIYAGSVNGGYTWAQYGFIPTAKHRAYLADGLEKKQRRLYTLLYECGLGIKQEKLDALTAAIHDLNGNSKAVRHIANFNITREDLVEINFNASFARLQDRLDDHFLTRDGARNDIVKIGQWLLTGERWDGILSFSDAEAMSIRAAYVRRAWEKLSTNSFTPVLREFLAPKLL